MLRKPAFLLCVFAGLLIAAPSVADEKLCNVGKTVCVAGEIEDSLISNPLRVVVKISSSPYHPNFLAWEVKDDNGKILGTGDSEDIPDYKQPNDFVLRQFTIQDLILLPATTSHGRLTIYVSRADSSAQKNITLPKLEIPIRLDMRTTSLTLFVPEDMDAYHKEFAYYDNYESLKKEFETMLAFVPKPVNVMRASNAEINRMQAVVEMLLKEYPGQAQWHLAKLRVSKGTAYVKLGGGTWAGCTIYLMSMHPMIKKSLMQFKNVKRVVIDEG